VLVGYEMIVANVALHAPLAIYSIISYPNYAHARGIFANLPVIAVLLENLGI